MIAPALISVLLATVEPAKPCPADIALIEQKLSSWASVTARKTIDEITAFVWPGCEAEIPVLQRAASVDPSRPSASGIIGAALVQLAQSHSAAALATMFTAARSASPDVREWAALALATRTDNAKVMEVLASLGADPDARVRVAAYSGLAAACSERAVIIQGVAAREEKARRAAYFWLAKCGNGNDADLLAQGLADSAPFVRRHAANGLLRLESPAGCVAVSRLNRPLIEERQPILKYQAFCKEQGVSRLP